MERWRDDNRGQKKKKRGEKYGHPHRARWFTKDLGVLIRSNRTHLYREIIAESMSSETNADKVRARSYGISRSFSQNAVYAERSQIRGASFRSARKNGTALVQWWIRRLTAFEFQDILKPSAVVVVLLFLP